MRVRKSIWLVFALVCIIGGGARGYQVAMRETDEALLIENTYTIYNNIVKGSGEVDMPGLSIVGNPYPNAWTDGKGVYITVDMLRLVKGDEDMIAMILAHELAHVILKHPDPGSLPTVLEGEHQADMYGTILMMRAGYNVCVGKTWFRLVTHIQGDKYTQDHPSNTYREYSVNIPQYCGGEQ